MGPFLKRWEKAQASCVTAVEKGPGGSAKTRHQTHEVGTSWQKQQHFSPRKVSLGTMPEILCGSSLSRLVPTYLTIPEEAFPIDVSLGFTYFW